LAGFRLAIPKSINQSNNIAYWGRIPRSPRVDACGYNYKL